MQFLFRKTDEQMKYTGNPFYFKLFFLCKFQETRNSRPDSHFLSGRFEIFSLLLKTDILISWFLSVSFIFLTVKIEKLLTSVK